jgi:hypothetical protein
MSLTARHMIPAHWHQKPRHHADRTALAPGPVLVRARSQRASLRTRGRAR